ncbi:uncharacterized protein [Eurosta solidaginis]|uniref:uncharacterized protein n=1 Tax=Eurosta solidaginis TaxID=178769 RepID=UPI003530B0C3
MYMLKSRSIQILYLILAICIVFPNKTCAAPNLLNSYLPAAMQALAYYIDYLQYEPLTTTTVEPPFSVIDDELNTMLNVSPTTLISRPTGSTNKPTSSFSVAHITLPSWSSSSSSSAVTTKPPPPFALATSTAPIWWQPPAWWHHTTTTTTAKPLAPPPTPLHKPGIYAPIIEMTLNKTLPKQRVGYEVFDEIGDNIEGFDKLTLALIRDIQTEPEHDEFTNDVESLDNFLRLYDDNYGRAAFDTDLETLQRWPTSSSASTAGKKRVPPTKPYVEFLLIYDLLKRDAKAANLSKYEGYSEELLQDLHDLSHASAERQLYTLFKRMIDRGDVQRSDVVSRIQGIMKDLANPKSTTVMALRYIPAMPFLL